MRRPEDLSSRPLPGTRAHPELPRVSAGYPRAHGSFPTCSSPVRHVSHPKVTPFDLHALGTPPALILSQDQTLHQVASFVTVSPTPTDRHRPSLGSASLCLTWSGLGPPRVSPRRSAPSFAHHLPVACLLVNVLGSEHGTTPLGGAISPDTPAFRRERLLVVQFAFGRAPFCVALGFRAPDKSIRPVRPCQGIRSGGFEHLSVLSPPPGPFRGALSRALVNYTGHTMGCQGNPAVNHEIISDAGAGDGLNPRLRLGIGPGCSLGLWAGRPAIPIIGALQLAAPILLLVVKGPP